MALRFSAPRGATSIVLKSMLRGPVGPTGAAATVNVGTTTTLGEGNSATVANSGSTSAAIFDFGLPRGAMPAVGYNFSTTTTDSDPGSGSVRFNNATPASVTEIYFDNVDRDGNTQTAWLDSFDDSTNTTKGTLAFTAAATPSTKVVFTVSGSVVDGTGYRKVTVSHVSGTTLPSNAAHLGVSFSRAGNAGTNGTNGTNGATVGTQFTYSTTTTDSDPGSGVFRFNNATIASVTAGYFDNNDAGGSSVTGWLDTFDDSTNTNKGTLVACGITTQSAWALFTVTGSVVDGTGYRKLTLSYLAHGGTFTNGDTFAFLFSRAGDKGTDGAGTGDVTGPSSSVDSEIAIFNSTTGKVIKRASTTGILKATSGVLSAASAGTDYYNPGGTDVAVADGGTGSSTAAGAATNLGLGTGDSPQFTAVNLSHATANTLTGSGGDALIEGSILKKVGKETIWIPAAAMTARTTNGAAFGTAEMTTNKNMFKTLDFDTTTQEFAQFEVFFPKSWNLGTVTFRPLWSHASTSTNFGVVWGLAGVARSDDDAGDVAFGTAQTSTDTGGTTNDIYVGPESSAITIAGSPAVGDSVQFQIARNPSDGSDTMAIDARLHGVQVFFTTSASTDA